MDLLMEKGAMAGRFSPILMKKNRPATCFSLLCAVADEERFKEHLFRLLLAEVAASGTTAHVLDGTNLDNLAG
jgi:uncharacterized protein (DUF111 family)